jgi:hypothetical protein
MRRREALFGNAPLQRIKVAFISPKELQTRVTAAAIFAALISFVYPRLRRHDDKSLILRRTEIAAARLKMIQVVMKKYNFVP